MILANERETCMAPVRFVRMNHEPKLSITESCIAHSLFRPIWPGNFILTHNFRLDVVFNGMKGAYSDPKFMFRCCQLACNPKNVIKGKMLRMV